MLSFSKKTWERYLIIGIVVISAFLRLYRLPDTMQFLGDQGRDALIARGILIEHDPAFIGPVTSVGNMYLGPFYYYFMVFPLMLTYPSPVGPAYAVAIIGIVTTALLYLLGKDIVGNTAGLIASGLYAVSPTVIENARFSWNPNIVPFFSLILLWCVHKIWISKDQRYWILAGVCAIALFQLHYISLALIGLVGFFWMYVLKTNLRTKKQLQEQLIYSSIALIIFLVSLVPLAIFDYAHNWLNLRSFLRFFDNSPGSEHHFRSLADGTGVLNAWVSLVARVCVEFFGFTVVTIGQKIILSVFAIYFLTRSIFLEQSKNLRQGKIILSLFLLGSITILSLYSSSLFDHYLGFVFPLVFLGLGVVFQMLLSSYALIPLGALALIALGVMSTLHYPGVQKLDGNIYAFERTARVISAEVEKGERFNVLLYSRTKDLQGMNYRYFLTTLDRKPQDPDNWTDFPKLIIIDEEEREVPLDESQYVIKIWPNRTIQKSIQVQNGPRIYILTR